MLFEAFWLATNELPFDALTASCTECYRLSVETSHAPQHRIYRLERSPINGATLVVHHFAFSENGEEARAKTHAITLEEPIWHAWDVLLALGRFWELPAQDPANCFDGSTYTLEGWKHGRKRAVSRCSPSPFFSGGELFAISTDYLERIGELAMLECDDELRGRYISGYVPSRQLYPKGNLA